MKKGSHCSEEHKRKVRENNGMRGKIPWNKGKHGIYSVETLKKMAENHRDMSGENNPMFGKSSAMLGKHHSEETRRHLSKVNIGKKHSKETRRKMSECFSDERKMELSRHWCGKKNPFYGKGDRVSAEKNNQWKGEAVGRTGLHAWIRRHKNKPELCETCRKVPPYDVANISGDYRRDIDDYKWLCRSCHMKSDGRLEKLRENNNKHWSCYYDELRGARVK